MGPMRPVIDIKFHAATNSDLGTVRIIANRATGIISAPPTPCKIRASTSQFKVGEAAQATEPSTNTATASRNTLSVPSRSASQPESGISAATVSA